MGTTTARSQRSPSIGVPGRGWRRSARSDRPTAALQDDLLEQTTSSTPIRRVDLEGFAREMEARLQALQAEVARLSEVVDDQTRSQFLRA